VISKEWTVEQVQELTVLAKRKGYNKGALATALLGVHPSTISEWLKPERGELPMMTRHAIERVEMWLKTRHDVLTRPKTDTEADA
jgi:DNA-binding transcriptional regulator YdaS (Cro superfamily)